MIKNTFILFLITLSFFSCSDEINYRTPFEEKPVLYCILNGDNNTQYVMLKKSFYDKNQNTDNYIKDAKVQLIRKDETVELNDTTIEASGRKIDLYYTISFFPILGEDIMIKTILDNGMELSSSLVMPKLTKFFIDQIDLVIPPVIEPEYMYVSWTIRNSNDNLSFLPRLTIHYKVKKNNIETEHVYEIPEEYVYKGNQNIPIYPLATQNKYYTYLQKTINTAFEEISKGDENKSDYTIQYVDLEVFIMEENLAAYATSIESFNRGYSVKVYETTISNIKGGLGVFGAYIKRGKHIPVDENYIASFGYQYNQDAIKK